MDAAGNASIHELARCTVREVLNALLDAGADAMYNAQHYERSQRPYGAKIERVLSSRFTIVEIEYTCDTHIRC